MMWNKKTLTVVGLLALAAIGLTNSAYGDAQWIGGSGVPLDIWSEGANWDTGAAPSSATDIGVDENNVARMYVDGTTTLIDASVNAVAFGVQVGYPSDPCPISGTNCAQAATNDLVMTGGTLTTQGNFLFNVGRGRNEVPTQLTRFMMSGGLVNAAGITVPEGFNPDNVLGFTSLGINAEMHVSGNSVVNTDLLRLGAADAKSTVVLSDNAQVNLTDDNGGFANGVLWIEAFESPVVGTSLLDIRDNAVMTVHGEWWTDENGNGERDGATASEAAYFRDVYVANGWIVANGGVGPNNVVEVAFSATEGGEGVITMRAVPEPASLGLLALVLPFIVRLRRKR